MKPIFRWPRWGRGRGKGSPEEEERADLLREIERTRDEWVRALHLLDHVVEPELIDHAIYTVQAAQRKYEYLMRVARNKNLIAHMEGPSTEGTHWACLRRTKRP
ncbi:MAG: YaaL family protein [Alicyclobacillaceae bacterium]|nr:YaaL family protein [Alicyclobacillaceae bacterium]